MSEETAARPALPPVTGLLAGQLVYHLRVLVRTPRAIVGGMLLPVLLLMLRRGGGHPTHSETAQLIAGLSAFGVLSTAYITHAAALVGARQAGVLKRWRAAPLPPWCFFTARITATTLLAASGGAITVLVGDTADGIPSSPGALAGVILVLVLGAATWSSIGTAASAWIPTVEAAWPLLAVTYLPVVVLSGGFGTFSEPAWLDTVTDLLPVRPLVDGVSHILATGGGIPIGGRGLAVLAGWSAAAMLVSLRAFRWTPRPPGGRRRDRPSAHQRPTVTATRTDTTRP